MSGKSIIYITNSKLVVYCWNKQRLEKKLQLFNAEKAKQPLSQYFQQLGNKPIKIVVDILEEMNSLESLPHLNARDRKSVIERKKRQLFPGAKFIYSEYKGRGKSERRDDLILFSAITDEKLINSWLVLLFEFEVNIAGIFSLPVLLQSFAEQLQGKTYKLVITVASDGQGILLRQSYFKDNILVLSRFKQINELDQQKQAEEIEADVNRSQRFISRHFSINNAENLSAFFFGSGLGLFEKINFSKVEIKPVYISTFDFAKKQGNTVDNNCSLAAYICGLAAKKTLQKTHYKDEKSSFYYNHFLIKIGLNGLSLLFISLAVIYSFIGFLNHSRQQKQSDDLRIQRSQVVQTLANTAVTPLFKGHTPGVLENHLKVHEKIKAKLVKPEVIMNSISLVLEQFSSIRLTKLEWGAAEKQDDSMNNVALVDPTLRVGMEEPTIATQPSMLIVLQAQIEPFDGDFRYALALIQQFSDELQLNDSIEQVTATKLPVDISTDNELSGAIKAHETKAEFILDIKWQR